MSHTRVIAYNTLIQTIGKAATVAISFFLFRMIARYLGVSGVGEYTTIFAWSNFLAILADLGFQIIIVRELAKTDARFVKDQIASTIISMRTVVALLVFSVGVFIAQLMPYTTSVKLGIAVGAMAVFWLSINSTLIGIFQANFRMDKAVLTDLIGRVIILIGVSWVVANNLGLIAIMAAYIIGNLINVGLSYILTRPYLKIQFIIDWPAWKSYFKDAVAFGVILIFAYIYFRIDAILLSLLKSSYDVGIYGVPYKILEIILFFPALFLGAVFPLFAKYGATDQKRLERIFHKTQDVLVVVGLPVTIGVIMLARPIVSLVSGPEFLSASTISVAGYPITAVATLQILMIAVFLSYLSHPYNYVLTANGFQGRLVWPNVFYAIINIVMNIIFIPLFSYLAAAVITVITEFLVLLVPSRLAKHLLDISPSRNLWWKSSAAALAMGITIWLLKDAFLVWPITLGGLVYVAALWLVQGIDREILKELSGKP